ncbi:MAG: hypothetical protein KA474_05740 [Acinetobacter sp.]|nr:hypothetical protein [Acinetobacter sp.]
MLNKLAQIFTKKPSAEQVFMEQNRIEFNDEQGFMINGFVLNDLSERLEYFSNRKLKKFDDLKDLYFKAMLINEKIDLEIANNRFVVRLGNTEENLLQLKAYIALLNDYYRQFKREK